jgi:inner membrane protease subunit 2
MNRKVASIGIVQGHSMSPTLNPKNNQGPDFVLLYKMCSEFKYGDVVFFTSPQNHKKTLVKRIVAMQGDLVRRNPPSMADILFIPDLIYNYSKNIMHQNFNGDHWIIVPQGHVWVESDSAEDGVVDSRYFGPIPIGLIVGRVEMILYPWSRYGQSLKASQNRIVDEGRLIIRNDP